VDQRPGNGRSLLLTARHFRRIMVQALAQTHLFQQRLGPRFSFRLGNPGQHQGYSHILLGR
jgi:hypothetical protein